MKTIYQFRHGWSQRGNAQQIGETLEDIRNKHGSLTPSLVVDYARKSSSVLHDNFEWGDKAAAEKYRGYQARQLIGSIMVVRSDEIEIPTRAFVSVPGIGEDESRAYTSVRELVHTQSTHLIMMEQALRELRVYMAKYKALGDLIGWQDPITKACGKLEEQINYEQSRLRQKAA